MNKGELDDLEFPLGGNYRRDRAETGSTWDNLHVSHLLFVDDSLILCRLDEKNYFNLRKLLNLYEAAFGESINFTKSTMIFSPNVGKETGSFLSNILGIKSKTDLGSYLGIPSSFSKNKFRDFQHILDKVWKVVQGWKSSFFLVVGKEVLIKSVVGLY